MSRSRFLFLATCLRFDVRENRSKDDRLAPIREIWEKFIAKQALMPEFYIHANIWMTLQKNCLPKML